MSFLMFLLFFWCLSLEERIEKLEKNNDSWGSYLNENFSKIDDEIGKIT